MLKEFQDKSAAGGKALQLLTRLSSLPVQSIRSDSVVEQAVAAFAVRACVFHRLRGDSEPEIGALQSQQGINSELLSRLATRLIAKVRASRKSFIDNDLTTHLADDPLVSTGAIKSYLGSPLFDSTGALTGIVSLFAEAGRPFDEPDQWSLEAMAQLISAGFTSEAIKKKSLALKKSFQEQATDGADQGIESARHQRSSPANTHLSVLVVDDEGAVLDLLHLYLTDNGHDCDTAESGFKALQIFSAGSYDAVITDAMMPKMNGWELSASLRKVAPELPILMMTGYSTTNTSVWNEGFLKSQGVIAVLSKPIDFEYLTSVLRKIALKKKPTVPTVAEVA